ncbi:MAG TPA: hypothetical protein VMT63_07100 [Bacteroidales bacterium]|nr:hypothetical protein [Bacteroidales bacterium]
MKKIILIILLVTAVQVLIFPQARQKFTGDAGKFKGELTAFLGPNLSADQTALVNKFFSRWDSSGFSQDNMKKIMDISSRLAGGNFRISPHFLDYLKVLSDFTDKKDNPDFINNWLKGLLNTVTAQLLTNDNLDRYFRNTSALIISRDLFNIGNTKWSVRGGELRYLCDTIFKVTVRNATLMARSGKDSTEIFNVNGIYYPEINEFRGTNGTVYWVKAGYSRDDVSADIFNYTINTTRTAFNADSARLKHKTYFKEPVFGKLSDQATSYSSPEKAIYPRFETTLKKFFLKNLYEGVNYEGGLTLEGASVKGTGDRAFPALITLYRNDTLYIKVACLSFLFSKTGIVAQDGAGTLYLGKDSIYNSTIGFSYNSVAREVTLFRTGGPTSKSPYFDSFHSLDMYFENLSWNMKDSKVILSRSRGSAMGQAKFESSSFYSERTFERLAGMDDEHPLYRLRKFADWFYSTTFPIHEFAKWMDRSEDAVTGLCIDMANRGFLFYDRANDEVTLKKKVDDYLSASAGKKDYDVINIMSQTNAPLDNAILDLKNYRLTVNGVQQVFLSDSQKVAIYPYKERIVIGKNRSLSFDGVVEAGLFTIFGHSFTFNYDTFKIRLQKIDSIRIAVETDRKDKEGNPVIKDVDNLIQLSTAELYIDDPKNKSGLKSYQQYPIINAISYSYIFFDRIPGMEGVYKQGDFFFKVDPFTYENIDHYKNEEMNLAGEFHGGNILKPTRQYLTVQKDNSLGFTMAAPPEGVDVYGGKGRLYDTISMSNKGLTSTGTLKRLSSTTQSDLYTMYPDSMIAMAKSFDISIDAEGRFPDLRSRDVSVKWLTGKDEWIAVNQKGKSFSMFGNGTTLDGRLSMTPLLLKGSGTLDMPDSRIAGRNYNFASQRIQSDTSDYNLKALNGAGFAFIAENVNTTIDFQVQKSKFRLNTDSSMVKFPEVNYICKMTDFTYDMKTKILDMEQRGKSSSVLLTPEQLLKLKFSQLDKPTFFSTNMQNDTVSFSSWKGRYNLQKEIIEAENINYIHIADALIQPNDGKITISKGAKIRTMDSSVVAVNNRHILHSASISVVNSKRYTGSAIYDYKDVTGHIEQISFPDISVDTATTTAKGYIGVTQKFMLSPAFSFSGDVALSARADFLTFTGAAGLVHNCRIKSYNIKFKSAINPKVVMIPYGDKPRDINDNLVFSGSFINIDSTHMYPAFLSERKSWSDAQLVNAQGMLYFDSETERYKIASREKIADPSLPGNQVAFDKNFCILSGEGKINLGTNYDLLKFNAAGKVIHAMDSGKVDIDAIIGLDFFFTADGLKMMSDEIRSIPTLKAVNLNSDFYKKGMKDLIGETAANQINEEMGLYGTSKSLPKEFSFQLLLNDVKLHWNEPTSSFRSKGKIGIGFIGQQAINVYLDGYVEIQRRRSGDMLDVYLKADETTWYYFSYFRGVLMTQAGNLNYNNLISAMKIKDRKHPEASVRVPYTFMISSEDRLNKFLARMASNNPEDEQNK